MSYGLNNRTILLVTLHDCDATGLHLHCVYFFIKTFFFVIVCPYAYVKFILVFSSVAENFCASNIGQFPNHVRGSMKNSKGHVQPVGF